VPETYSFWDLHVAIQDAMGWLDCHLHEFCIVNPETGLMESIGIPDEEDEWDREVYPGWHKEIAHYFSMKNRKADYTYDFGDDWQHGITLEKILPRVPRLRYPVCVAGARACPPEDCGGVGGYEDFLRAIIDPENEEYEEVLEWVGGAFDPEAFHLEDVHFSDPHQRWKHAFTRG
jgi:hypothetical protein